MCMAGDVIYDDGAKMVSTLGELSPLELILLPIVFLRLMAPLQ